MIEDGLRDEILSGDEIRELLRDEERHERTRHDTERDELQSVLVVSRREEEVALLRGRLERHGASVTVVRNPFTALDQIRTAHYRAIVTDLGLWASGGLLLFERWRPLSARPALVFIADRGEGPPETIAARLRRSGALDVLFRPLRARDVEGALLAVLGEPPAPPTHEEAPKPESPPEPEAPTELAWLRLFFHASRMIRSTQGIADKLRALVALFDEHLKPSLVATSWSEGGRSLWLASSARAGRMDSPLDSLRSIEAASGREAIVVHSAEDRPGVEGGISLLLAGLPDAHRYRDDLRHLLQEAARPTEGRGADRT